MDLRDEASCKGLDELCRKLITPGMTVVEIGCFGGESTCIFAQYAGRVYAVDPWSDDYRSSIRDGCSNDWILAYLDANPLPPMTEIEALFDQRVEGKRNVVKVRKASRDALAQFLPGSIDLVYIDSIHTEAAVAEAIREWRPKLKPGGIVAGHDYDAEIWPEVVHAVDREFSRPHYVFGDTSWAVRLS